VTRGRAAVAPHRMCNACLTLQPEADMVLVDLRRHGHEVVLACASPVVCRQRAQLRGVWGVTR